MNWRQLLGTDPDQAIETSASACSASIRPRTCSKPSIASGTPMAAGTGRSTAPSWSSARPDGATRRVLGLVVDITARKMRETALSAADQRFRAIARELRCVVYEIDAETRLS